MKKLLILAAVIAASVVANAASFKWTAGNMYGADGTTKWTSAVNLYAIVDGTATLVDTATASNGIVLNKAFETDKLEGGNYYDFYFTLEDGDKVYTSDKLNIGAQATSRATIGFGDMHLRHKTPLTGLLSRSRRAGFSCSSAWLASH